MKADQEVSEESQIYNEVGILSSVKECSMFHLYFSQATSSSKLSLDKIFASFQSNWSLFNFSSLGCSANY